MIDVINRAYDVETGNTGVSFKCARRSENLPDPQNQLKYFHVLEENGKIVGVVKTRMKENADVVIIGPVAVDQLGLFADELTSRLFDEGVTRTTIQGSIAPEVLVEVPSANLIFYNISILNQQPLKFTP